MHTVVMTRLVRRVFQGFFVGFLVVYAMLIVTNFHQYPFDSRPEPDHLGRIYEIVVALYISGLAVEEMLQASLLFIYSHVQCQVVRLLRPFIKDRFMQWRHPYVCCVGCFFAPTLSSV